jgi:putative peptidoglycan lipid II flippase
MTAVNTVDKRNSHIARSTLLVILAYGMAKGISLVQTFIIAGVFGVGAEWDAYVTASRIPDLIFTVIAGGALINAFIPIFSAYVEREDEKAAWRVASQVVNTAFLIVMALCLIAYITAPWLVTTFVAPGFNEATTTETVGLMRLLLLTTLIFAISGIVTGILQSYNHFLLPALAPIMFDVGVLFGAVFLIRPFGVYGIAYGAIIGAFLHLAIQVPGLFTRHARWLPLLGFQDPELRRFLRLMLPRVIDAALFIFGGLLANNLASQLGERAVSAYDWGWRLMQIPETLIGTAMATVIFPTLAFLSQRGDVDGKRDAMSNALRFILIATIPSAIVLVVMGYPLVSLLERGEFTAESTMLVYNALQFFAFGIIMHAILEVAARSFFADKDTLTPLFVAFGGAAVNLLSALWLSGLYSGQPVTPINVGGLALANTLGVTFEVIVLLVILRRRWNGINENILFQTTVKTLIASAVMAIVILLIDASWRALGLGERGTVFTILQLSVQGIIGTAVFIGMTFVLKMDEIKTLLRLLLQRTKAVEAA